jgi:hypothetical protein
MLFPVLWARINRGSMRNARRIDCLFLLNSGVRVAAGTKLPWCHNSILRSIRPRLAQVQKRTPRWLPRLDAVDPFHSFGKE